MDDSVHIPSGGNAGMGLTTIEKLRAGEPGALAEALVYLARFWFERAGVPIAARAGVGMSVVASDGSSIHRRTTPEQRALLAAGCDLYDLLAQSPDGRKALGDLVFQHLAKDAEGE